MANDTNWKQFFLTWAPELPRRGILVTTFGEQLPFSNFLTSEAMLFLERTNPDSLGARAMLLPYDAIAAVKMTEVVKAKTLREAGFSGPMPKT